MSSIQNNKDLYVVYETTTGSLETGCHSTAVPKLYTKGAATARARYNNGKYWAKEKKLNYEAVPVTLTFGTPIKVI